MWGTTTVVRKEPELRAVSPGLPSVPGESASSEVEDRGLTLIQGANPGREQPSHIASDEPARPQQEFGKKPWLPGACSLCIFAPRSQQLPGCWLPRFQIVGPISDSWNTQETSGEEYK